MIIVYEIIKKTLVVLTLAAIVCVSLTACCEEKESNRKYIHTDGVLIINGLDNYIGDRIVAAEAEFDGYNLTAVKDAFINLDTLHYGTGTATITNHSIELKLYIEHSIWHGNIGRPIYSSYNGNHKNITFDIITIGSDSIRGTVAASFTDGIGEGDFIPDF